MRTRKTDTLSLLVSDISNPFFSALVKGVEDTAQGNGLRLLICNTAEDADKEALYIKSLLQRRVDGIIISPVGQESAAVEELLCQSIPCALIDRVIPGVAVDAVLSENYAGAYKAVKHLIVRGHERIGLVLGMMHLSSTQERMRGYEAALADSGHAVDPSLLAYGESCVEGGIAACKSLLKLPDRPTAVFALNNLMTVGVASVLLRHPTLRCPEDVSLVGFDDSPWAELTDPPITTVAQDPYAIGAAACRLVLKHLQQPTPQLPEVVRIPTKFIERGSVSDIRSHRVSDSRKEVQGSERTRLRGKAGSRNKEGGCGA
jgi:LacI family transcriptional regulator